MEKKSPDRVDIHVGSRIRMRRLMVGLSQEKLAAGLGITFQQVQKYEKGTNRVGASRLQAISVILDVRPSFFFDGMEGAEGVAGVKIDGEIGGLHAFIASKEGIDLNRAFVNVKNPKVRKRIISLAKALAAVSDDEDGEVD